MYKSLQACRAVAACLVVLFHLGETVSIDKYYGIPAFAYPFSFGHAGVEFSFVLSRFIIFHIHARDLGHPSLAPPFALKRAIRIYSSYWLVFLPILLLIPQDSAIIGGTGAPIVAVA